VQVQAAQLGAVVQPIEPVLELVEFVLKLVLPAWLALLVWLVRLELLGLFVKLAPLVPKPGLVLPVQLVPSEKPMPAMAALLGWTALLGWLAEEQGFEIAGHGWAGQAALVMRPGAQVMALQLGLLLQCLSLLLKEPLLVMELPD